MFVTLTFVYGKLTKAFNRIIMIINKTVIDIGVNSEDKKVKLLKVIPGIVYNKYSIANIFMWIHTPPDKIESWFSVWKLISTQIKQNPSLPAQYNWWRLYCSARIGQNKITVETKQSISSLISHIDNKVLQIFIKVIRVKQTLFCDEIIWRLVSRLICIICLFVIFCI